MRGRTKLFNGSETGVLKWHRLKYKLKRKYKLTIKGLYGLLELCNYRCEICQRKLKGPGHSHGKKNRACVDHNHQTGLVRGILCADCNWGLGLFQDNPDFCEQAAIYLRKRK